MKKTGTVFMVVAITALAFAAQAFGMGGGQMGGSMGGSMGGGHQMSSGMHATNGAGMKQGPMNGTGPQHTAMGGMGTQSMMQDGAGNAANSQHGQMKENGNGMPATQPPAITTPNSTNQE